jgi:hypothetical protein
MQLSEHEYPKPQRAASPKDCYRFFGTPVNISIPRVQKKRLHGMFELLNLIN